MNLIHLKYAVEVAKTGSVSKAAENLYMGQPNLSRAIKELEESLGVTLFKRTTKGIKPTVQGEEFLSYATDILSRVERVEAMYRDSGKTRQQFSISIPRASYIADAFLEFAQTMDFTREAEIYYKETNAMRAINNLTQENYNLGIIRYQSCFEQYFNSLFRDKGIIGREIAEFPYTVVMSKQHKLAAVEELKFSDLADYVQVAHGDPYVPSMSASDVKKAELFEANDKRLYIFERASQFDLLTSLPGAYMFVSPVPKRILDRYELIQKPCVDDDRKYKDVLIYLKEYHFSELDKRFLEALNNSKNRVFN